MGCGDGLTAIMCPQLSVDAPDLGFNRVDGYDVLISDVSTGQAGDHEAQHFQLAFCERISDIGLLRRRDRLAGV